MWSILFLFTTIWAVVNGSEQLDSEFILPNLRVIPFIHVAKKYFDTRFHTSNVTWLTNTPAWAEVYLFNLLREGAPQAKYETILIDTEEHGHNSNVQFFKTLQILFDRHKNASANVLQQTWYLKLDDDAYVHWPGLLKSLRHLTTLSSPSTNTPLYFGNCGCMTNDKICKQDPLINCTLLNKTPRFEYICGGSGILMNHALVAMLLDYENTVGCPYSLEDITVGHCVLLAGGGKVRCTDNQQAFRSLNNWAAVKHYDHVKHHPQQLGDIAIWETSYKNEVPDMHELWKYYNAKPAVPAQQQQQQT